jgi:amidohydrolase
MIVKELANKYHDYAIQMRRELHMNPEVGMKEFRTQKRVMEELQAMGIDSESIAGTGVVAYIKGNKPGKTIALRADMDALEVLEENESPYKSQNTGVMHACGHDGHTAGLLTAAKILSELKEDFPGTVKLLFQPGEEGAKGGPVMVREGAVDNVDGIFGIHLWNECEVGTVSVEAGPRMASAGLFKIFVTGKGGHGSMPHQGVDAGLVASTIHVNLQTILSREINPLYSAVVSVGIINAGNTFNIMPGDAYLEGTTRCFNKDVYDGLEEQIRRIVESTAYSLRAEAKLEYIQLVPPVINDFDLSNIAQNAVTKLFGSDANILFEKTMAGEDFSLYADKTKAVFALVGSKNENKLECFPHHHPKFDIDEDALCVSSGLYAQFAIDYLNQ